MLSLSQARKRVHALNPCSGVGSGAEWIDSLSRVSAARAWQRCDRGDWLLWLAARAGVDRRLIVLAACDCARLALVHVPAGEARPRIAIETAERWARGEATLEEVRADADAATAVYAATDADVAYADDATYAAVAAADAAAYAATAVYAATADDAATYAADATAAYAAAADAAVYAADAAAADAQPAALAECADLVRARITWEMIEEKLS